MFIAPKLPGRVLAPVGAKCIPADFAPTGEGDHFACLVYRHLAPLGRKHFVIRPIDESDSRFAALPPSVRKASGFP
jgi:hypothetical protein